jgi:hypothetical protein
VFSLIDKSSLLTQVIKKRRIVLASVLKPVDDTRMFEKIGATLSESGEFEVSIIGYPSTNPPLHKSIKFLPLPEFNRISLRRLFISWVIFKKINKLKPEWIIINTPELLFVSVLSKVFFGRKIIYDVLENYNRNIRYTATYPFLIRPLVAWGVRFFEIITSPLVYHYLLAEKGYAEELRFAKPHLVLENKLPQGIASKYARKQPYEYSRLIFSGTLAASSGVFEAINLSKKLHEVDHSYTLVIIGYCSLPEVLTQIKKDIQDAPFITLIGGEQLVQHSRILDEVSRADFGIIIYPPNPSTQSSIPTKLYEYLALQLPVMIRHNNESHELVKTCTAGIILSETPNYSQLSAIMKNRNIIPAIPDSIYWETGAKNLTNRLNLI